MTFGHRGVFVCWAMVERHAYISSRVFAEDVNAGGHRGSAGQGFTQRRQGATGKDRRLCALQSRC